MGTVKTVLAILALAGLGIFLYMWRSAEDSLQEAAARGERLNQTIDSQDRQIKDLGNQLTELTRALKKAQTEIKEAGAANTAAEAEMGVLRRANSQMNLTLFSLEDEIAKLKNELKSPPSGEKSETNPEPPGSVADNIASPAVGRENDLEAGGFTAPELGHGTGNDLEADGGAGGATAPELGHGTGNDLKADGGAGGVTAPELGHGTGNDLKTDDGLTAYPN
jgi:hypothetical protein